MQEKVTVQVFDGYRLGRRICSVGWNSIVVAMLRTFGWFFVFLIATTTAILAQTRNPVPTVETIIARMAQARIDNQARFRSYIVTREYKLFGKERQIAKSQVIAEVTFDPPDSKKYAIQQVNGNGVGERIVRRILASEVELTKKDDTSADISSSNYDFRFIREEEVSGQPCYVLELIPLRKDKNLLSGNIWIDANTYLLRRAEGELAKNSSWWLRNVRIALRYEDVGGMWLQTALEATAAVRLLGPYTIVSHDVKYKISELDAVESPASKRIIQ